MHLTAKLNPDSSRNEHLSSMGLEEVVLVGSGGHAKVVIDILEAQERFKLIGCVDPGKAGSTVLGYPILGDDSILLELYKKGVRKAFVAIGDNGLRLKLASQISALGYEFINIISPSASVSSKATLGFGIVVMPHAVINACAKVDDQVIINTGATVDHDCIIARGCHIAPGCHMAGNVTIHEGSFLGIGSSVIPGIKIGKWAVIGAASAIVQNVPDLSLSVGVPARVIRALPAKERT